MDDLLAIEALVVEAEPSAQASDSQQGSSRTPSKRARVTTEAAFSSPPSQAVTASPVEPGRLRLRAKTEPRGDPDPDLMAIDDGDDSFQDKPPCPVCGRHILTGQCFLRPGTLMSWALPQGRGSWCRDCYGCWRLRYDGKCNPMTLAMHISSEAGRREWTLDLVSYLSLKRDGTERVSEPQVASRRSTIEWILTMLGLPPDPFRVIKLRELPSSGALDPSRLVNMMEYISGVPAACLGYLQPAVGPQDAARRLATPLAPTGASPCLLDRMYLSTDFEEDVHKLHNIGAQEVAQEQSLVLHNDSGSSSTKGVKMENHISWARAAFIPLQTPAWTWLKESHFSTILNKLFMFKTECAGAGKEHLLAELDEWSAALGAGKFLIKKYSLLHRSSKTGKVTSLHPYLGSVISFMQKEGMTPFPTLLQMHLKVILSMEEQGWDEGVRKMVAAGLQIVLGSFQEEPSSEVCAQSWLRATIFQKMLGDIESLDVASCDARRPVFHKACVGMRAALYPLAEVCELACLLDDIALLGIMFEAGLETKDVAVADAARFKENLEQPRFTLLRPVFQQSPAGVEFLSPLLDLLKRSASDQMADERFNMAQEGLSNGFRIVTPEGGSDYEVVHAELVLTGNDIVWSSLTDVIQYAMDAHLAWSPLRAHEQQEAMVALAKQVIDGIETIDVALAWLVADLFNTISDIDADTGGGDTSATPSGPLHHSIATLNVSISRSVLDPMGAFSAAQTRCLNQFISFAEDAFDHDDLTKALIRRATRLAIDNATRRGKLLAACDLFMDVRDQVKVATGDGLIEQWRGASADTQGLAKVLDFLDIMHHLAELGSFQFLLQVQDREAEPRVCLRINDVLTPCICIQALRNTPAAFEGLPSSISVRGVLNDAASGAVDAFADIVQPSAFRAQAAYPCKDKPLADILPLFCDESKYEPGLVAITRVVLSEAEGEEPTLPGKHAFDFMMRVLKTGKVQEVVLSQKLLHRGETKVPLEEVSAMCFLYLGMYEIIGVLFTIGAEMRIASKCIKDHVLRTEMLAYSVADENLFKSADALSIPWLFHWAAAQPWLRGVFLLIAEIRSKIFQELAMDCKQLTILVEKHTPRFDHFINDKTFVPNLAKRHLCESSVRATLSSEVISLFHSLSQLSANAHMSGHDNVRNHARYKDIFDHADVVFASGKTAVTVIAACNIVFSKAGSEQKALAKDMVALRASQLPGALLDHLRAVSEGSVGCGLKRKAPGASVASSSTT